MPGAIQSIERAAAVLRLLAEANRAMGLNEIAAALNLPRPTAHGIVRTLCGVGFVEQDPESARYRLGRDLPAQGRGGWDRHELRSRAMNWADALAGGSGLAVVLGVPDGDAVLLAHHVFRPDGSPQRIRTGEKLPLHATATGKCLLAFAPAPAMPARRAVLHRYTGRTCITPAALESHLDAARRRGWSADNGEYESGVGGAAAALRAGGGLVVGALGITGPVEELFGRAGQLRPALAEQLVGAAREVSATLATPP